MSQREMESGCHNEPSTCYNPELQCDWQGYGFGAPYQDAACCEGEVGDLDDCDEPGAPIGLRGETCPQCHGTGKMEGKVGTMALIRQRELNGCLETCGAIQDSELANELRAQFKGWHDLVIRLESE